VEGHQQVAPSYLTEVVQDPPPLLYTDDTAMTMALAESLLACYGFDGDEISRRFVDEYRWDPHRGYGGGVVTVFDRVDRGIPWEEASARQFGGSRSYGNGGAMRVTPVALFAHPDLDQVVELAVDTARVTHTHPVGIDGAIAQAVAVALAISDADTARILGELDRRLSTEEFHTGLDILARALDRGDDEWAVLQLGHGVAADRSVLTALYCYLASDGFQPTVLRTVAVGGGTDTTTSMAAAIARARYGESAIPRQWRAVEASDPLLTLADRLHGRAQS
jgi:poly(ADP-ribose) glycohydrolase ARH3